MIRLVGLVKKFKDREILLDSNLVIENPGIYVIYGESGSGKSTLINILGLLDKDYDGDYYLFDQKINNLNDKEKELIRFNQISYIFQTPKFLENENVKLNIEIGIGRKIKAKEVKKIFKEFNLNISLNKKVSTLSGGERKRIAIAIAVLKDTPIILADEITVGLDEENKRYVLDYLMKKAKSKIILMVTHDIECIKNYTNKLYELKNKKLDIIKEGGKVYKKEINKNNKLKNWFLLRHVFSHISLKPGRTFICSLSMIVALVCLGFCLLLTSSLSKSITSSLSNTINDHQIIMSKKEESFMLNDNIVIQNDDMDLIKSQYGYNFTYEGCNYLNDFSKFFKDDESFYLNVKNRKLPLSKYSVNDINNFTYFNEDEEYIYTNSYDLQEDEVIIGLSLNQVYTYCNILNIPYINEQSLLSYFTDDYFLLSMYLVNNDWEYEIEVNLKVVGYYISNTPIFFHTDSRWNEYIIEHVLQLPYSNNLNQVDKIPWMTKKINYFTLIEGKEIEFINNFLFDDQMSSYQYGIIRKGNEVKVYFTYSHEECISKIEIEQLISKEESLSSYIACSDNSYNVIKEALLSGFSYPTFLSNEYNLLEEYIDYNTYSQSNLGMYQSTILTSTNKKMISLNLLDGGKDNYLTLKTYLNEDKKIIGNYPKRYNELIISSGLASRLNISTNSIDFSEKPLYFMTLKSIDYVNGKYKNNFVIEKIYISGIIDDNDEYLYVSSHWPSIYLSLILESSSKKYLTNNVVFEYNGTNIEEDINLLNKKYPNYIFSNPFLEYKKTVDETIGYINLGLGIFSLFSLLSAVLMMIISSYLFVVDTKKEIGIYTFYGYTRKSINKQFKSFGLVLSLYSSILSSICLTVIMIMLNEGTLGIVVPFDLESINPFILINVISLIISDIASFFSTRRTLKESPLKQLQEN